VYFSTPNGNLLDANPALVGLLGYEKKENCFRWTRVT